eukprot:XP_011676186.1 PREDICTED: uncharacterized protein LOC105444089 [Strongylocentrotus purpuratus]
MAVSGIHPGDKATDPWRFVILLSRFTLSALQQGAVKSFGVLMPSLVLRLDSHYQTVGFILSMEYAVFMMTSPFVHLLSQRFEPRSLAVVGALLSSVCMMLTSAVRSVWVIGALFMAAGALSSPVFQTSHVLLHEYFNHRYAAANALASTGAQAGGIVLPIVTSHVLIAYGVEGALLSYLPVTGAIGGLFGRLTAGGVLYLRPKWGKRTLVSGTIISSVGLLIFGLLHSHISQFISTFFAGFGLFATFTSFYAILHDSVAKENFSGIIAFTSFIRGFGVATGGYATGLIFELTGSFAVAFRVLACMDAAILILIFSFALIKKIN